MTSDRIEYLCSQTYPEKNFDKLLELIRKQKPEDQLLLWRVLVPKKMHPFYLPKRFKFAWGGRWGSKTHSACKIALHLGSQEKARFLFTREIQNTIAESLYAELKELIYGLDYWEYKIYDSYIFNTKTKSEFIFKGLQQQDRKQTIKSLANVKYCIVEEAQTISKASLDILVPTIRKAGSELWFLYNQMLPDDPVEVLKRSIEEKEKLEVNILAFDNLFNSVETKKDIERLKRQYEDGTNDDYLHVVLGHPASLSDRVVLGIREVQETVNRVIDTEGAIEIGVDVARFGKDRTVFFKRKGMKIVDWKVYKKKSITDICGLLVDFVGRHNTDIMIKIDDTGIGCFTMNTEVLTTNGWINVRDLKVNDIVFSKNENGNVIKEKVLKTIKREKTSILNIDGIEFAWSHLLNYKTRNKHNWHLNNWEYILTKKNIILDNESWKWKGEGVKYFELKENKIEMPNGGERVYRKSRKIKLEHLAHFLGWFISEGHLDKSNGYLIGITQKEGTEKAKDIEKSIKNMGYKISYKKNNNCIMYKIFDKSFYDYLSRECYVKSYNCYNKKIPEIIKNSNKKIIRIFLDAFLNGDGYRHKENNCYITSSKKLVDDLLECIYKTGNYANSMIKEKKGSKSKIYNRVLTRTTDIYIVNEWKSNKNIYLSTKNKKEYFDNVYQINISGKTKMLYNRVGNKCFWTHNGGVTDFMLENGYNIEPIIFGAKASEPDKYNNLITEMWFYFKSIINEVSLPDLQELKSELSTREYKIDMKGRKQIESKDDYRKRYSKSPDLADALLLCYYESGIDDSHYFGRGV